MSTKITRRKFLGLTGTAVLGTVITSCAPVPVAVPTTQQAPAAPAKPAEPVSGGSWKYHLSGEPVFNPVIAPGRESNYPCALLFNQLCRPDKDTLKPSPDLATKWEAAPDGLSWTFTLRQGVKWHDGKPFSADDVKFTFDSILDPKTNTRLRADLSYINEVQVVDPGTVRFLLKQPFAALPVFMGYCAGIVPKHLLAGQDINTAAEFNKKAPVGTGPFKFKEYVSGSHVTLVANPEYFRGRPKLDSITLKILADQNTIAAQLNTEELSFGIVEPAVWKAFEGNANLELFTANINSWWHVSPNLTKPLFQDKRVRQAVAYGIDRQAISNAVGMGKLVPAAGPIPAFLGDWYNPNVKPYPYDLEKAKKLLAEAGWTPGPDGILRKDGQPLKFVFSWGRVVGRDDVGTLVHQYLKKLGMDVTAESVEWSAYMARFQSRDFEVCLDRWQAPYDPDVYSFFHTTAAKGGKNATQASNPEIDKLLEQGRAEGNEAKRKEIYFRLQEVLAEELPTIFMLYHPEFQVRSRKFGGLPKMGCALGDLLYYADEFYQIKS